MAVSCGALSVFVRSSDGQCREAQVAGDASVAALRGAAPFVGDLPLFFAGKPLEDGVLLADAGIGMQAVVDVGDAPDILRPDQIEPAPFPAGWDPFCTSVPVREKGGGRRAVLKVVEFPDEKLERGEGVTAPPHKEVEQYVKDVEDQMAAASIPQLLRLRGVWPIALAPAWMLRRHYHPAAKACILVWEYADGRCLQRVVESRGPAPPAACAHLARQLLLAARYCSSPAAVLHPFWFSPRWVFIAGDGAVKVGGFSRHKSITAKEVLVERRTRDRGALCYLSPQIVSGERTQPGEADDVHSIALIVYFAACGKHQFAADVPEDASSMQFLFSVVHQQGAPALNDGCPDSMQRWLEQCFVTRTGSTVADAFEAALSHPWLRESDEAADAQRFREWLGAF
eukprot:TRINITY_DN3065_c0_g4_i1.p1 TRINITY_DN3065_c0_g4~~TRINITY_DN3065_c0_g4_i1.p1  ORF type:complete len:424 (+),score=62.11 TRINITY_DN3065_c0_g4_i1:81-1274(+)